MQPSGFIAIMYSFSNIHCSKVYVSVCIVCPTACQQSDDSGRVEPLVNGGAELQTVVNGDASLEANADADTEAAMNNPEDSFRVDKREETEQINRTEEIVERPDGSEEVKVYAVC